MNSSKLWNSIVMFGPLEVFEGCNIPVEDYYIQGITKDGKLYIGSKTGTGSQTGTVNADKTGTGSQTSTGSKTPPQVLRNL